MTRRFTISDLEGYLDEALPAAEMSAIEEAVRRDPQWGARLAEINARRDAGMHTLGEIWRRERLSCPSREQLGSYLLGALPDDMAEYVTLHLEAVACRWCRANLDDLERQQSATDAGADQRRRKYFQSSAGYLNRPG